MKIFGDHKFLIFALALSLSLHLVALGGVRVLELPFFLPDHILSASLENEESVPSRPVIPKAPAAKKSVAEDPPEGTSTSPLSEEALSPPEKNDQNVVEEGERETPGGAETVLPETAGVKAADDGAAGREGEAAASENKAASSEVLKPLSEKLKFDIYWMGIFVGRALLEAVPDGNNLTIRSETHSAALISAFYKVEDYIESRIIDGKAATFRIKQREGKYRSDKEVRFDPESGTVTYFDYLKDRREEHPMTTPALWDVVSAFYYVRTQPLEVGKTIYLNVFDSNKFMTVEVDVLAREKIRLADGSDADTIRIKPVLKSDGIFQKKGDLVIWLTDDDRRIPVKVETEVPVGKIVAKLKDFEREGKGNGRQSDGSRTPEKGAGKRDMQVVRLSGIGE